MVVGHRRCHADMQAYNPKAQLPRFDVFQHMFHFFHLKLYQPREVTSMDRNSTKKSPTNTEGTSGVKASRCAPACRADVGTCLLRPCSLTATCRIQHAMPLPAGGREGSPCGWRMPWSGRPPLAVHGPHRLSLAQSASAYRADAVPLRWVCVHKNLFCR